MPEEAFAHALLSFTNEQIFSNLESLKLTTRWRYGCYGPEFIQVRTEEEGLISYRSIRGENKPGIGTCIQEAKDNYLSIINALSSEVVI